MQAKVARLFIAGYGAQSKHASAANIGGVTLMPPHRRVSGRIQVQWTFGIGKDALHQAPSILRSADVDLPRGAE